MAEKSIPKNIASSLSEERLAELAQMIADRAPPTKIEYTAERPLHEFKLPWFADVQFSIASQANVNNLAEGVVCLSGLVAGNAFDNAWSLGEDDQASTNDSHTAQFMTSILHAATIALQKAIMKEIRP